MERGEILDGGDREEREDGEEISFLDKLWSESEHEEGSAESWYQHWYTNAKSVHWLQSIPKIFNWILLPCLFIIKKDTQKIRQIDKSESKSKIVTS